ARRRKAGGACDDQLPGAGEAQGRPLRYHGGISKVPAVEVQLRVRRAWREGPRKNKGPISVDIVCVAQRERLTMPWANVRECPPTVASRTSGKAEWYGLRPIGRRRSIRVRSLLFA